MDEQDRKLLLDMHATVARIDERTKVLPVLDQRIDSLEQTRSRIWGWFTGAGLAGGGVSALFSKLFGN